MVTAAAGPTSATGAKDEGVRMAVAFARVLRGAGLGTPVGSVLLFADALGGFGLTGRDDVYWAGVATLLTHPEDRPLYDQAFAVFWEGRGGLGVDAAPEPEPEPLALVVDSDEEPDGPDDDPSPADDPTTTLRFSAREVLRRKDFATYTPAELDECHRLMVDLRLVGAPRRSRRLVPSRGDAGRVDLRRTARDALRAGGEPMRRHHLTQGRRSRRLVLLLDISGSMEPYARALLRFVHAAVVGRQRVEAFALGTRLTRLTRELSDRDPDSALRRTAEHVHDWSGGTRLGEGLRAFNDGWGVRGTARGAIVVILSDGWDRGDPELLAEQMQRLHRVAHQVVWVNPLKVTPGYAPLARGMAAALPYVDDFVEGHSVAAIERLAKVIST